jgi:hypothetical protein
VTLVAADHENSDEATPAPVREPGAPRTYSEATQRTFERALDMLEKKLTAGERRALAALLVEGRIDDVDAIVRILEGKADGRADR